MKQIPTAFFLAMIIGICHDGYSLEGKFSATVFALDIDRHVVAQWLPAGVCLKTPGALTHKVILMLGTQRDVRFLKKYNEVIVVVPDVTYLGKTYMFFPKLYLDRVLPIIGGRRFFGFPKEKAWMEHCLDRFQVGTNGKQLLHAKLNHQLDQPICRGQNYAEMVRMLSQPMLLVQRRRLVCSRFNMQLDRECITRVTVEHLRIQSGFMPCLPEFCTSISDIDTSEYGAFYIHNAFWNVPRNATECLHCHCVCLADRSNCSKGNSGFTNHSIASIKRLCGSAMNLVPRYCRQSPAREFFRFAGKQIRPCIRGLHETFDRHSLEDQSGVRFNRDVSFLNVNPAIHH